MHITSLISQCIGALLLLAASAHARSWDRLMDAIIQVESNGNQRAVSGDQVGCMQIRPIMVHDINRILQKRGSAKRYTLRDRYSVAKSREMFVLYQSHYNPKGSTERAIRLWNGGCKYTVKGTQGYYLKVKKELKTRKK